MLGDYVQDYDKRIQELADAILEGNNLLADIANTQANSDAWRMNLDASWAMTTAFVTFLIIIGFALMESGFTRRRYASATIFNHTIVACVVAVFWWFTGYGFAFGGGVKNRNGFIGNDQIFLVSRHNSFPVQKYDNAFFHFAVTVITTLLASGATAERLSNFGFLFHAALHSGFVWPVVAHWLYSDAGFFSPFSEIPHLGKTGVIDTGFSAVHIAGGAVAFASLIILGPRNGDTRGIKNGNNRIHQTLGAFFALIGWFGITMGGVYRVSGNQSEATSRVAINVALCSGTTAFAVYLWHLFVREKFDVTILFQGALAGLVGISAACATVEPYAAFLIGLSTAVSFLVARFVVRTRLGYDDTLNIVSIHLVQGLIAILWPGVFATHVNVAELYGHNAVAFGFLYDGDANQFGVQIFAALIIFVWSFIIGLVWNVVLNAVGLLRLPEEEDHKKFDSKEGKRLEDEELTV
jgi:Amt family ammonium transporter